MIASASGKSIYCICIDQLSKWNISIPFSICEYLRSITIIFRPVGMTPYKYYISISKLNPIY